MTKKTPDGGRQGEVIGAGALLPDHIESEVCSLIRDGKHSEACRAAEKFFEAVEQENLQHRLGKLVTESQKAEAMFIGTILGVTIAAAMGMELQPIVSKAIFVILGVSGLACLAFITAHQALPYVMGKTFLRRKELFCKAAMAGRWPADLPPGGSSPGEKAPDGSYPAV